MSEDNLELQRASEAVDNSVEALASEYGWKPEGEKSASEYVRVAMEKFPDQSKKIKQLFRTMDEMKEHMQKVESFAYEKAKKEFEQQKRDAIRSGNVELVEKIDQEIQNIAPSNAQHQMMHPAIKEFEEKNAEWLNGSSFEELKMQQWIQDHGQILGKKKLSTEEHMRILDDHVRKQFPDYFDKDVSEDREVEMPVSRSRDAISKNPGKKKKYSFDDLTSEQKRAARDFEQMGIMKIEKYIEDLVKQGDLK